MLNRPSIALPGRLVVEEVADASRCALRAFLSLEPAKPSLSGWLLGPYRLATCFGPRRLVYHGTREPSHGALTNIEDLVRVTQVAVVGALEAAQRGVDDLIELLPPVVHVVPAHDVYGNHGFIPVDEARMRLIDRVLGLLVADYLTRPCDFLPGPFPSTHATRPWAWLRADAWGDAALLPTRSDPRRGVARQ